ncbi:hypothetical protein L6V77_05470 [Myxococcota bacterium]|nr:hypothetical protein [Myxococcota bacterium]
MPTPAKKDTPTQTPARAQAPAPDAVRAPAGPVTAPAAQGQASAQRAYMGALAQEKAPAAKAADPAQQSAGKTTVPKAPAKMGSLEAIGQYLGSFQVARGEFADVEVWVDVPIPQLPGATGKIGLKGTYTCDKAGKKELSLSVDGGLAWELFKVIRASVRLQTALKLSGDDLGAAFTDALKQNLFMVLQTSGVDNQVQELARLAKDGPSAWELAQALVPIYGTYDAAKIAIARVGKDKVLEFHRAYGAFFHNNPNVGFESSVAVVADAEIGATTKGKGTLEGRVGLEDVDNKKAKKFAEVAGEVMVSNGNNLAKVRVAKRRREGGQDVVKLDLSGQFSVPRSLAKDSGSRLANARGLFQSVKGLYTAVRGAQEGRDIPQISGVANALLSGFGTLGIAGKQADFLQGIEANFTWTNGTLSACTARLKNITQLGTGTGQTVGPVEANVQLGTFTDVSKEFAAAAAG